MKNRTLLIILAIVAITVISSIALNQGGKPGFLGTGYTFGLFGDSSYGTGLSFVTHSKSSSSDGVNGIGEPLDVAYYISQYGDSISVATQTTRLAIDYYPGALGMKFKIDVIKSYWWTADMWINGIWTPVITKTTNREVISGATGTGVQYCNFRGSLSPNIDYFKLKPFDFVLQTKYVGGLRVQLHILYDKSWDTLNREAVVLTDEAYIAKTDAVEVGPIETTPGTGTTLTIKTIPSDCSVFLYNAHGYSSTINSGVDGATFTDLPGNLNYVAQIQKNGYKSIKYEPINIPGVRSMTFQLQSIGPEPTPPVSTPTAPNEPTQIVPGTGKTLTIYAYPNGCTIGLFGGGIDQGQIISSAAGATWVALPTATYTATIKKDGYQTITYDKINMPGVRSIRFTLQALPSTTLTIKTNPYGSDVRLTGNGIDEYVNSGTLGAKFQNLPEGTYTAYLSKDGYLGATVTVPSSTGTYTYSLGGEVQAVTIISNHQVLVQIAQGTTWQTVTADDTGKAVFEGIGLGAHRVSISGSGYSSQFFIINVEQDGNTEFILMLGSEKTPPTKLTIMVNYPATISLDGGELKQSNGGEAIFFDNMQEGDHQLTATSLCDGTILERVFTFPDERWLNIEFPMCKKGGTKTSLLTVFTDPVECTVNPEFYGETIAGVDGASFYLKDGPYDIIVKKDGYDTQTTPITIRGEDVTLFLTLEQTPPDTNPVVTIRGPSSAGINELITVTAIGDREKLYYNFDFGDGYSTGWTQSYVLSHYYKEKGQYTITVQAETAKGLTSEKATTTVAIEQIWKLFVPQIIASDTTIGKLTNVTIYLPTNLDVDNYYIQAYVRTAKGEHIVPRWTTLENTFANGTIVAYFEFRCNQTGALRIGVKGIAMEPTVYKDTDEITTTIQCRETGVSTTGASSQTETGNGGALSVAMPDFLANYYVSIGIVAFLCIIVIIALVFLIRRNHLKTRKLYRKR